MNTLAFPLVLLLPLSIFLSGCGGPSEWAASFTRSRVVLTVTDIGGNPVSGAVVSLYSALASEEVAVDNGHILSTGLSPDNYTLQASEVTDADGHALFPRVPPGNYTLQALKEGMAHQRIRFEVISNESLERNVILRPVKEFSLTSAFGAVPKYQASFNGSIPGPTIAVEHGHMTRITISVPKNDIVHLLRIDELGIQSPSVHPGNSAIIEFVADAPGTFYYYCPLPGHRALGMEGKLVVRKDPSTG